MAQYTSCVDTMQGIRNFHILPKHPTIIWKKQLKRFNHEVKRDVGSKQPIGVVTSSSFFVDLSKLEHRADIRSDDLGVWINKGVRSTYSRILFDDKIKKIVKMPSKPSVMSPSVYRLKRLYWVNAEAHSFQRRLIEIEGTCT